MISLRRYLDSPATTDVGLLPSVVQAYRSTLTTMGMVALQACPSSGDGLPRTLTSLGQAVAEATDPETVASADAGVTQALQTWGDLARANLQQKADDVKELLVVLARTGAVIAASDKQYSKRFDDFTVRLEGISTLEDITQLRASLIGTAAELRTCVDAMSQSAKASVAQLQAEVVTYQTRLEEAERIGARDPLTGLWNRARVAADIERRIALGRPFSVAVIDLNGFKQINDQLGHTAGDDLLKQFSEEMRANARASDLVGRWGGDEFVVVLDCGYADAQGHVERIKRWVVGDYTIASASGPQRVQLGAAIGLAQWTPGQSMTDVVNRADADMYANKRAAR